MSKTFLHLKEVKKVSFLRNILFKISGLVHGVNTLCMDGITTLVNSRSGEKESTGKTPVVYDIKGRIICRAAFGAICKMSGKNRIVTHKMLQRTFADTSFLFLKRNARIFNIQKLMDGEAIMDCFKLSGFPLCEVISAKEGNRKQYLQVNVLNRYYPNDNQKKDGDAAWIEPQTEVQQLFHDKL